MKPHPASVRVVATLAIVVSALRGQDPAQDIQATFVDLNAPEARSYRDTGDRAIDRLAMTMITDAANAVSQGGEVAALDKCHLKDVPMKDGFVGGLPRIKAMKLTSLKLRNAANAPDAAEQAALTYVRNALELGTPPELLVQRVTLPGGDTEWRVYKPLANIRHCGTCHSQADDMRPELRAAIQQKFPSDQANGFATGQWRGLIRVTVADPPPPPARAVTQPASPAPAKAKKSRRG